MTLAIIAVHARISRLHLGQDGHFQSCFDLECAVDAQICEAKKFVGGHDVELWQRDRLVAKFEPRP